MAEAVHLFKRLTSQVSNSSTSFTTALTLTAAEFASAGFANNDEVLVLAWGLWRGGASGNAEVRGQVTYNGSLIGDPLRLDTNGGGATGLEQNGPFMFRLDLATLADLDLDIATATNAVACTIELASILVVRLDDLGTEGTDWYWDEDTSLTAFTTSFADFATVTFTPPADDYVAIGSMQIVIDQSTNSTSVQMLLDAGIVYGPILEEGESNTEELGFIVWHIATLDNTSHTITMQGRDDGGTTTNDHRRSSVLVFRKSLWADIYTDLTGTVAVPSATATQIGTITSSVSANQDAAMIGLANKDTDVTDQQGFMWVRQGGSTVIDPVADDTSGISNWAAHDGSDFKNTLLVGYLAATSGAQDLDLFIYDNDDSQLDALQCRFLFWGMLLASEDFTGDGASTLEDVTSAGDGTYTPPAITGTGSSTLGDVTSAGSGTYTPGAITGTGSSTLGDVTSAGSGTFTGPITGTGASTLEDITSVGQGFLGVNGTGSSTLGDVTSSGSGVYTPPAITGSGASTLEDVTSVGVGILSVAGKIENVVCDLLFPDAACDLVAPEGSCDLTHPLVTCSL